MSVNRIYIDVLKKYESFRLDKFLAAIFPNAAFSEIQKLIRKKEIKVNNKKVAASYRLSSDDIVSMAEFFYKNLLNSKKIERKSETRIKISKQELRKFKEKIIYKDTRIIAINKPHGLAVQGGKNIKISVDDYLPYLKFGNEESAKLVHRIDKDTSGILLIARNNETTKLLFEYFKSKNKINKTYLAIIVGKISKKSGIITHPLIKKFYNKIEKVYVDNEKGKEAITKYQVLAYSEKFNVSLIEVNILTGRTHQIRVHTKEIGHPILGDGKYGGRKAFVEGLSDKLHLHAYKLEIKDLGLKLKADLSERFLKTLKKTRLKLK